jgi:hypothetical protein
MQIGTRIRVARIESPRNPVIRVPTAVHTASVFPPVDMAGLLQNVRIACLTFAHNFVILQLTCRLLGVNLICADRPFTVETTNSAPYPRQPKYKGVRQAAMKIKVAYRKIPGKTVSLYVCENTQSRDDLGVFVSTISIKMCYENVLCLPTINSPTTDSGAGFSSWL